MNIVTFNIACIPKYVNLLDNEKKRLHYIKKLLKKLNPDIILLQEVFSNYSRDILKIFFKKNNYNIILSPNTYLYLNGGLVIASKYKIINSDYYIYKNYFGEDSLSYKGILYTQIIKNNKVINIFNTHTNNTAPIFTVMYNPNILQEQQLNEFIDYVYFIKNKNDNYKINYDKTNNYMEDNISYILGGDFNLDKDSDLYKKFLNKLEKNFKICINKKKIITDNINNTQIDYIINCYNKNILYTPYSNTFNIENKFYSDHNILIKHIL